MNKDHDRSSPPEPLREQLIFNLWEYLEIKISTVGEWWENYTSTRPHSLIREENFEGIWEGDNGVKSSLGFWSSFLRAGLWKSATSSVPWTSSLTRMDLNAKISVSSSLLMLTEESSS